MSGTGGTGGAAGRATTEEVEGGLDDPSDLEPDQGDLDLAGPDDRHSRADWEAAAAAVLRKARRLGDDDPDDAVWSRLTRTTLDGVDIAPLGTPDLLDDLATRGRPSRSGPWDVRAHLVLSADAEADHETLLTDLEGGVTSLWLAGADAGTDWDTVLDGVLLDLAPVVLEAAEGVAGDDAAASAAAATSFLAWADGRELEPRTNLGIDAADATTDLADAATGAGVRAFVVDATAVHDRGAADVQELAAALAGGAAYLRAMEAEGVAVDRAAGLVEFRYAATDEQFTAIAKLRAARRLWQRVLELSGAGPDTLAAGQLQHVVTSRPMMSRFDPYVNLLRTTVAAFAAGVGGADAVTVLPFDSPLGRPEALGRRMARNTSMLLAAESHIAAVADPAGGAYAVEKLTDDLAVAAWELFGRLEDGLDLDAEIERVAAERDRQVATRKRPITGLSEFPDLAAEVPERQPEPGREVRRYGAAFEALRDDAPCAHAFLATLGPVAAHTARATFATNLLAAGGVGVDVAGATEGPDDLAAAHDGQAVALVAGTDAAYDEWGEQAAAALREAGATYLVVAGRPRDWADDDCAMGVDAIAFLDRVRERLA